jgi:hypothetical protein
VRAAILHLANQAYRDRASRSLMLRLPDFVAAGRWMDAWLVQHCAFLTLDSPDESNPLLFKMFGHGYDRWAEQQRAREASLLKDIGLDLTRLENMSLEEMEAWMAEQQTDPVKKARFEAMLMADPQHRAQATANLQALERDSVAILERDDAADLMLSPKDLAPWVPQLNTWMTSVIGRMGGELNAQVAEEEKEALAKTLWPILAEMAGSIFTPERLQQLIAQLKAYRSKLFATGEKRIAGLVFGAITALEREDEPAKNYFLNVLCFTSLRRLAPPDRQSDSES